jgi:precorrin-2 dehydrogenase/sirohydrochlorin ferrochelatase
MAGYPITLQLAGKKVLIIGGGKIAARKATALIEAYATVFVFSPTLDEAFNGLAINWIQGEYEDSNHDFSNYSLIFAATDNPEVNYRVGLHAKQSAIFVNVLDNSTMSDFHNMAVVERGTFTIGISSNGVSPALVKILKERIAAVISDGFLTFGIWLASLRVIAKVTESTQPERQALYERIIASEVLNLLEAGKREEAQALFNKLVEEAL